MKLLIACIASVVFVALFHKPLGKWPWAFYVLACTLDVAYVGRVFAFGVYPVVRMLLPFFYQGIFAFGLLAIVMYIGVLPRESRIRRALAPVRGELSIFASILMAGHVANYAGTYVAQRLAAFSTLPVNEIGGLVVALILAVLLSALAITSVGVVRKGMASAAWKKIQRLAYPFFFLIYLHLVLLLAPSAFARGGETLFDLGVYTLIAGAYLVLRVRRMLCDNSELAQSKTEVSRPLSGDEQACSV